MEDDDYPELTHAEILQNRSRYVPGDDDSEDDGFYGNVSSPTVLTGFALDAKSQVSSSDELPEADGFLFSGDEQGYDSDSVSVRAAKRGGSVLGYDGRHLKNLENAANREIYAKSLHACSMFRRARPVTRYIRERKETAQLRFQILGVQSVMELADRDRFVMSMGAGVVHTNLIMPTSSGKTTIVPGELVAKLGKRVLVLVPDYSLVTYAVKGISRYCMATTREMPEGVPAAWVMSYYDFVWRCGAGSHTRLVGMFDIVYVDEAHVCGGYAEAVRDLLATYFSQVSVVLATATKLGAESVADFRQTLVSESIVEMDVDSDDFVEKLATKWNKDRTMILMPDEYHVYKARDQIKGLGYLPEVLDNASTPKDVENLNKRLEKSSGTPRYIIATNRFACGYDIVSNDILIAGYDNVFTVVDGKTVVKKRYFTSAEREQAAGRVGRRIRAPSTATFLTDSVGDSFVRQHAWARERYMLLRYCGITPLNTVFDYQKEFGKQLTQGEAYAYVVSMLPYDVLRHFVMPDGGYAKSYAEYLNLFVYADHRVVASRYDAVNEPLWKKDLIGDYQGEGTVGATTRLPVPFDPKHIFRILVHGLAAAKLRLIKLQRQHDPRSNTDESGDEARPAVRVPPRTLKVRDVVSEPRQALGHEGGKGKGRMGGEIRSSPVVVQNETMDDEESRRRVDDYSTAVSSHSRAARSRQGAVRKRRGSGIVVPEIEGVAVLPSEGVSPTSPGDLRVAAWASVVGSSASSADYSVLVDKAYAGSKVKIYKKINSDEFVLCSEAVYRALESGAVLNADNYGILLDMLNGNMKYLVNCVLFDGWSEAWTAVLNTMDGSLLSSLTVTQRNYSMSLLERLWRRHTREYKDAIGGSARMITKTDRFWGRDTSVVLRPTTSKEYTMKDVMTAVSSRSDKRVKQIAQSNHVKTRIRTIRTLFPVALTSHEAVGTFKPSLRTAMLMEREV